MNVAWLNDIRVCHGWLPVSFNRFLWRLQCNISQCHFFSFFFLTKWSFSHCWKKVMSLNSRRVEIVVESWCRFWYTKQVVLKANQWIHTKFYLQSFYSQTISRKVCQRSEPTPIAHSCFGLWWIELCKNVVKEMKFLLR